MLQAVQNNRMQVRVEVTPNQAAKDEYLNSKIFQSTFNLSAILLANVISSLKI
jgi:hypothetical protein